MPHTPDLNEALLLVTIVETGSITAAAERLNMQKSTVSRKLSQMEKRLGLKLLQRSTRNLHLTEIGSSHYQRCQQIVSAFQEAEQALLRARQEPTGKLKIVVPIEFGQLFLARLIAHFLSLYPKIEVEVELTARAVDLISEGIDLALRTEPATDPNLVCRHLAQSTSMLVSAPGYLAKHAPLQHPKQLQSHNCVRTSNSPSYRYWRFHNKSETIEVLPQGNLMFNNITAAREALIAGCGVGLLPELICAEAISTGQLKQVLTEWQTQPGNIYLIYPPKRFMPLAQEKFIDHCIESINDYKKTKKQ